MNSSILFATFVVDLLIGMLGLISLYLRNTMRRRHPKGMPEWEQVEFKWYPLNDSLTDGKKGSKRPLSSRRLRPGG